MKFEKITWFNRIYFISNNSYLYLDLDLMLVYWYVNSLLMCSEYIYVYFLTLCKL